MNIRQVLIACALCLALPLTGCAPAPSPTTSPSPMPSDGVELLALSPVPLTLEVPVSAGAKAWVAPLTGPDIDALGADAAVQLQFQPGGDLEPMVANVFWFTIARFTAVAATPDAPKGMTVGFAAGHVLFVQPALDMPFDPASADGQQYGALVERARDFRWYATRDAAAPLLRPCPAMDAMPTVAVDAQMLAAIRQYFERQALLPISLQQQDAWVLDTGAFARGVHTCANPDGGEGAYTGSVPTTASDAVMVMVQHAAYPVTGGTTSFVTLARMPAFGWMVVAEGTGP